MYQWMTDVTNKLNSNIRDVRLLLSSFSTICDVNIRQANKIQSLEDRVVQLEKQISES